MNKKTGIIIILLVIAVVGIGMLTLAGNRHKPASQKGQSLSRIEVYAADGTLLNATQDSAVLAQFSELNNSMTDFADTDHTKVQNRLKDCAPLYTIMAYKNPAAVRNDGKMEKIFTLTIFQNTNVIKTEVSEKAVKSFSVPSAYLTFYGEITDEEMQFIKSITTASTQK